MLDEGSTKEKGRKESDERERAEGGREGGMDGWMDGRSFQINL